MIKTYSVKESSAHNNISLQTFCTVINTVSQIRVIDVPKKIGLWEITSVSVQATYPNGIITRKTCTQTGGCYHVTLQAPLTSGKAEKGLRILADGLDENGNPISSYELGHADIVIARADGVIEDGGVEYNVHILSSEPEEKTIGDIYKDDDGKIHIETFEGDSLLIDGYELYDFKDQIQSEMSAVSANLISTQNELADVQRDITETKDNVDVISSDLNNTKIDVVDINLKIPNTATSENQLADKDFVNSSIVTNTAYFKGTFNSVSDLPTTRVTPNDYAFVIRIDNLGQTYYDRYKFTADGEWMFEYSINNSGFTAEQFAAINSGATSLKIQQIDRNKSDIELILGPELHSKADVLDVYLKDQLSSFNLSGEYEDGGTFSFNLMYLRY